MTSKANYIRVSLIGIILILVASCKTEIDVEKLDYFYIDRDEVLHIDRRCKHMRNNAIIPIGRKNITGNMFRNICSHCITDNNYEYIGSLLSTPPFLRGRSVEERQRDVYDYICENIPKLIKDYSFTDFIDLQSTEENRNITYENLRRRYGDLMISQEEFSTLIYIQKEFSKAEILENQQKLYDFLRRIKPTKKIGNNIYEFRELLIDDIFRISVYYTVCGETNRPGLEYEVFEKAIYDDQYDEAFD